MKKIAIFVDGSNLNGSLNNMSLRVDDYDAFFSFIYQQALREWSAAVGASSVAPFHLLRVYWYVTGSMDEWDLGSERAREALRDAFGRDRELLSRYMAVAGGSLAGKPDGQRTPAIVQGLAWERCFADIEAWYQKRISMLDGMRRFYYAVRSGTDFIDIIEAGHWRVDMLGQRVEEKGLDVSLAVDMVTLASKYDIAVVISGDADMLPSIRYCKQNGNQVSLVEFLQGSPPEDHGRGVSSRLRVEADFVTRIYEAELIQKNLGKRYVPPTR